MQDNKKNDSTKKLVSLYEKRLNDYYTYTWSYVFQVFSSIACIKEQKMDGEIIIIKIQQMKNGLWFQEVK